MDGLHQISNLPGLLLGGLILLYIVFDCRSDVRQLVSAKSVFLLTILAWYCLEAILVPDELRKYPPEHFVYGLFLVGLCVASFLAVYQTTSGGVFDPVFRRLAAMDRPRVIFGVFLIACAIGFTPLLYVTQGNVLRILEDAFTAKERWSGLTARGRYGGFRDAFIELTMFLRAAVPLAAAICVQRGQRSQQRILAAMFLAYMFAAAFNSGTRSKVVEVFLPIAAAVYWRFPTGLKRKALVFGLPAIAGLGLLWSAASVLGRNAGTVDWDRAVDADYVGFEMFRELLYITEVVPERSDYKYGHTYYVQAVNPIPRALWPGKPTGDAGLELAGLRGAVTNGEANLTISPGLLGEMYWNLGLPGILLISGFLGYLAKSWDRVRPLASQSVLAFTVFAAGLAIIFLSGRSINMATLYGMLSLFGLLVLFAKKSGGPRRRAAAPQPAQRRGAPQIPSMRSR